MRAAITAWTDCGRAARSNAASPPESTSSRASSSAKKGLPSARRATSSTAEPARPSISGSDETSALVSSSVSLSSQILVTRPPEAANAGCCSNTAGRAVPTSRSGRSAPLTAT